MEITKDQEIQEDLEVAVEITVEDPLEAETQEVIHHPKEMAAEQDLHKREAEEAQVRLELLPDQEVLELELKFLQQQVFKDQVHH